MKTIITLIGIGTVIAGCVSGQQWMIYLGGVITAAPLATKI